MSNSSKHFQFFYLYPQGKNTEEVKGDLQKYIRSHCFLSDLSTLKTFPKGKEISVFTLEGGHEDSHTEIKLLPDHMISFTLLKLG